MFGPSKKELLERIKSLENSVNGFDGKVFVRTGRHTCSYEQKRVAGVIENAKKQKAILNELVDYVYEQKEKK